MGAAATPRAGQGGTGNTVAGAPASAGNGAMSMATPAAGSGGTAAGASGATSAAGASAAGASVPTIAVEDLVNDGPYPSTTVMNSGPGNGYTIYQPGELAPGGVKTPVIAWISGGGSMPYGYTLLPHLATHGFMVIASNTVPNVGQQAALGEEMVAAIDWVSAEAERTDSSLFGKIDTTKVAAMGYSMGALAATSAGTDPRWTTTVHISGGAGDGTIKNLHAPAIFVCGASGVDIAGANCATDFEQATAPVFYGVFEGGEHLGIRTPPYQERIQTVVTGWLRWQLLGDEPLKTMFVGDPCTVCKDSNWSVQQKNLQ